MQLSGVLEAAVMTVYGHREPPQTHLLNSEPSSRRFVVDPDPTIVMPPRDQPLLPGRVGGTGH